MGTHTVSATILLSRVCAALLLMLVMSTSIAGHQKEEEMADSVRIALSRAISDPRPPIPEFAEINERLDYLRWLGDMSERLRKRLPDRQVRVEFLRTAWYEAKRAG